MTKLKDLQDTLLSRLSEEVERYGFDKKVRGQSFSKKTPLGRHSFHLSFIRHPPTDFDVTADIAIRFDELEDILNENNNYLSKAEKKNTFSLGAEIGNISEGRQKRWTVASPADVENVAQSIMDAFATIGIPYLEKHSDMETALEALSGDDKAAWLHVPFHDGRAKAAIGLAFLLGQRERFSQIAAAKTEFLTSRNEQGLQSFLQLRDNLERRFISQLEEKAEGHQR
ncbi:MAG: hypothetical protein HY231_16225 [Acidobacteria bacterium]|nr:hypothetical protein [Acidobacteriota bacterium]